MDLLYWLQQRRTPLGEQVFGAITWLGSDIMLIAVLCMLLWLFGRRAALRVAITYAATGVANQLLKLIFAIPRPWILDSRLTPAQNAVADATGYSFPSGHSQTAASIYTSVALLFRQRWLAITGAVIILAVMFSRMYLGVHTPWDVLCGAGLSLAISCILSRLLSRAERSPSYYRYVMLGGVGGSLAITLLVFINVALGTPADMVSDTLTATGGAAGFCLGIYIDSRSDEAHLPLHFGIPMSILGIVFALGIRFCLKAALGVLPGVMWQRFVSYAAVGLYVAWLHPAIMRAVQRRLESSARCDA